MGGGAGQAADVWTEAEVVEEIAEESGTEVDAEAAAAVVVPVGSEAGPVVGLVAALVGEPDAAAVVRPVKLPAAMSAGLPNTPKASSARNKTIHKNTTARTVLKPFILYFLLRLFVLGIDVFSQIDHILFYIFISNLTNGFLA